MDDDPRQRRRTNPFGMDETCSNCPELAAERTTVVHGYGDVGADFLFVRERPTAGADVAGVPLASTDGPDPLASILERVDLLEPTADPDRPTLHDAYVTHLTRCRHPARPPTDEEVATCEPFLDAEVRMINPEIIVPVGQHALDHVVTEYTTKAGESFPVGEVSGTSIRGRGFELFPLVDPEAATESEREAWIDAFEVLSASDYRQTKGRRGR